MKLRLENSDCAIRKHDAWLFFFFFFFFSSVPLICFCSTNWTSSPSLAEAIGFRNTPWSDLDDYSCRMKLLLAPLHPVCRAGLVVCSVGIVSDVGPSQDLFWFWLFPLLSPFCQRATGGGRNGGWVVGGEEWGGGLPFWTFSTNTTGWCMRWVSSGKAARSAGSPDRSPAPSAQAAWRGPEGRAWRAGGGERWGGSSDGESWGSQISFFRAANIYIQYIYSFFSVSNAQNTIFIPSCPVPPVLRLRQIPVGVPTVADLLSPPLLMTLPDTRGPLQRTQTPTHATTSLFTSPFLPFSFALQAHTHTHTHTHARMHACTAPQLFTPVSLNAGLCWALLAQARSGDSMQPPPRLPLTKVPRACVQTMRRAATELWCSPMCWRPHEANTHRMSAVSHCGVLVSSWIEEEKSATGDCFGAMFFFLGGGGKEKRS